MTLKENYADILVNVDKVLDILRKYKLSKLTIGKNENRPITKDKTKKLEKC